MKDRLNETERAAAWRAMTKEAGMDRVKGLSAAALSSSLGPPRQNLSTIVKREEEQRSERFQID